MTKHMTTNNGGQLTVSTMDVSTEASAAMLMVVIGDVVGMFCLDYLESNFALARHSHSLHHNFV